VKIAHSLLSRAPKFSSLQRRQLVVDIDRNIRLEDSHIRTCIDVHVVAGEADLEEGVVLVEVGVGEDVQTPKMLLQINSRNDMNPSQVSLHLGMPALVAIHRGTTCSRVSTQSPMLVSVTVHCSKSHSQVILLLAMVGIHRSVTSFQVT